MYHIVWKGENLTAKQFSTRLEDMFLKGDMRSIQILEHTLNNCSKRSSKTLIQWWAQLDAILAEFEQIGMAKHDREKKARSMYLIGEEYSTMAELLGGNEDVTYLQFQIAMLRGARERIIYGGARDQHLADATSSRFV